MMFFLVGVVLALPVHGLAEPARLAGPQPASAADAALADQEARTPAPERKAQAGGVSYTVQVGSFRERVNADAQLAELVAVYDDAEIVEGVQAGGAIFRVVSGRFPSLEGALTREQALRIHGFTTYVRKLAFPAASAAVSLQPLDGWRLVAEQVDAAKR